MNTILYMNNKNPYVKYRSVNPDTGNVKVSTEVYDKVNDEILENILHQTTNKKKNNFFIELKNFFSLL
ncbi:hypothetical protein IY230_00375 [Acholeplasma laidlawii]|uniref:hypothetical protein n=1 Tax=Acholeplasma laidlawii TaxID=2148 RepID=UPI0018C33CA3|nr:hypothetical protein [Acholeplasma laidlawii]MBG0762066.1 hypothetical protein [Acholeplasma laidlawii]